MSSPVSGFSARSLPFHSMPKSSIVSDAPTAAEALTLAGLDWHVDIQPAYQLVTNVDSPAGHVFREVPNRFLTVRQDTQKVLGSVGKVYQPFQNLEAFNFADGLLGYGIEYDAAGSYDDDRKIFLTAKLPDGITVDGTDDSLDLYLLFKNSHDGSAAIKAMITPIRLACTNMMNLATRKMVSSWSCRHTSNATERVEEATRTLRIVDAYRTEFSAIATQLRETEMNLDGFTKLVNEVTDAERLRTGMINTFQHSPTVDRTNAWGGLNAIGEFMEWERGGKGSPDSRFDSNIDGQTAATRNRALQLLVRR